MTATRLPIALLLAGLVLQPGCGRAPSPDETAESTITVFAAASATDVIDAAARRFENERGLTVVTSFGASSTLARQILAGAPADVFLSADEAWMDELERAGRIEPGSRFDLLANRLVLIVPSGSELAIEPARDRDLAAVQGTLDRFAIADPAHVPAGRYAKQALQWLGWWDELSGKIVPALDVRAALRLVEMGEADAGVVYATDAAASSRIEWRGELPADAHEPIRYPVAVCRDGTPGSASFVTFLRSEAADLFREAGFSILTSDGRE